MFVSCVYEDFELQPVADDVIHDVSFKKLVYIWMHINTTFIYSFYVKSCITYFHTLM